MGTPPSTPASSPQLPAKVLRVPDGILTMATKPEDLPTEIETGRKQNNIFFN